MKRNCTTRSSSALQKAEAASPKRFGYKSLHPKRCSCVVTPILVPHPYHTVPVLRVTYGFCYSTMQFTVADLGNGTLFYAGACFPTFAEVVPNDRFTLFPARNVCILKLGDVSERAIQRADDVRDTWSQERVP